MIASTNRFPSRAALWLALLCAAACSERVPTAPEATGRTFATPEVRLHLYADDYGTLSIDGNLLGSDNNPLAGGIVDATIRLTPGCHTISLIYRNQAGTNGLSLSWLLPGDSDLSIVPVSALVSLDANGAQTNGLRGDYYSLGGALQFTKYGEGPIAHGAISFTQENYQGVSGLWAGVHGPAAQFEERLSGLLCIS